MAVGDFERYVYVALHSMALGDPKEMLPELGLQSDTPIHALLLARSEPMPEARGMQRSAAHVWVLTEQHIFDLCYGLFDRLTDENKMVLREKITGVVLPQLILPNGNKPLEQADAEAKTQAAWPVIKDGDPS